MSDFNSALPIRTELTGQAVYEDAIVKLGDKTNPTTQQASVDTFGSQSSIIKDPSGNAIGDQLLSATYWLQVVDPATGPAQPGTAAAFSTLAGGMYNATPPVLTDGQQSALQVDAAGRLLVDTSSTDDHNYGVVGANTLRTAAQIGNATGAADFNAGATGAQTLRVQANQGAPGLAANAWFTKITDGTNTVSVTAAGEIKVDITQPLPAGSNNIGSVNQGTSPWVVSGTVAATQSGTWTVGLSEDHNWGVVGANTLRTAAEIGNATGAADFNYGAVGAQTLRTASEIGNATGAADFNNGATGAQTLRVAANLAVAGANVSGSNPVPVSIVSALVGTSINDYNTSASLAAGGTSNHIYTISSGKVFNGKKIWASASGALKIEVRISPDGSAYTTKWVGFNSTATPNITIDLDELVFLESGVGSTIEIIRTNEDKKAMDVYSTISGTEV